MRTSAQTARMKSQREKTVTTSPTQRPRKKPTCTHLDFGCSASRVENKWLGVFAGFVFLAVVGLHGSVRAL